MTTVIADDAVQAALANLKAVAEVRDRNGILLGYFTPLNQAEELLYRTAADRFDPQEIKRIIETEGHLKGITTQELLEQLRGLETS